MISSIFSFAFGHLYNIFEELSIQILLWSEYISPKLLKDLISHVMVLGGEAFERQLGHEGRVLMTGLVSIKIKAGAGGYQSSLIPSVI